MSTLYNIIYNNKRILDSALENQLFYFYIPAYMSTATESAPPQITFYKEHIRIENDRPKKDGLSLPDYGTFLIHDVHKIKQIEPGTYFEIVFPGKIVKSEVKTEVKMFKGKTGEGISVITNLKQHDFLKPVVTLNAESVSNIVVPLTKKEPATTREITDAITQYQTHVSHPMGLKSKAIDLMNRVYLLDKSIPQIMTIDDILLAQKKSSEQPLQKLQKLQKPIITIKNNIKLQAHYVLLFHYLVFLKVNMTQEFYDSVTSICGSNVPKYTSGMKLAEYIKLLLQWGSKCNDTNIKSIKPIKLPINKIQEVLDALHHTYVLLNFIHPIINDKSEYAQTKPIAYPTQKSIENLENELNQSSVDESNIQSSESDTIVNPNDAFDSELEDLYIQFTDLKNDFKTAKKDLDDVRTEMKISLEDDKDLIDSVYDLINTVEITLIPNEYKNLTLEDLAGEPLPFLGLDEYDNQDFGDISLFDVANMRMGGRKSHKKTRKSRTIYSARTTRKS